MNKDDIKRFDVIDLARQLRQETGYGMMKCKKALCMYEYDLVKAKEYLLSSASDFGKLITYKRKDYYENSNSR